MGFLERSGQIQFFWDAQVIISQHKSTELINIYWFGHSSLLLLSNIRHKIAIFLVLQKLTHMYFSNFLLNLWIVSALFQLWVVPNRYKWKCSLILETTLTKGNKLAVLVVLDCPLPKCFVCLFFVYHFVVSR